MYKLVDLYSGKTLAEGWGSPIILIDALEQVAEPDEDGDIIRDFEGLVVINGQDYYYSNLEIIDDRQTWYRVLPEYADYWFGFIEPHALTMMNIEDYASDSGRPLSDLMKEVEEL